MEFKDASVMTSVLRLLLCGAKWCSKVARRVLARRPIMEAGGCSWGLMSCSSSSPEDAAFDEDMRLGLG